MNIVQLCDFSHKKNTVWLWHWIVCNIRQRLRQTWLKYWYSLILRSLILQLHYYSFISGEILCLKVFIFKPLLMQWRIGLCCDHRKTVRIRAVWTNYLGWFQNHLALIPFSDHHCNLILIFLNWSAGTFLAVVFSRFPINVYLTEGKKSQAHI